MAHSRTRKPKSLPKAPNFRRPDKEKRRDDSWSIFKVIHHCWKRVRTQYRPTTFNPEYYEYAAKHYPNSRQAIHGLLSSKALSEVEMAALRGWQSVNKDISEADLIDVADDLENIKKRGFRDARMWKLLTIIFHRPGEELLVIICYCRYVLGWSLKQIALFFNIHRPAMVPLLMHIKATIARLHWYHSLLNVVARESNLGPEQEIEVLAREEAGVVHGRPC